MDIVRISPEHVHPVLRLFDVELGYRQMLIKSEFSGYSREVMLKNLDILSEYETYEIVPSIDILCESCPNRSEGCEMPDTEMFMRIYESFKDRFPNQSLELLIYSFLKNYHKEIPAVVEAYPFTYRIGHRYGIEQLRQIRDHFLMILEKAPTLDCLI